MRALLLWLVFWVVAPAAAVALDQGPAEPPPADFAGRQYIDSRGCVFLRDAEGTWTARRSRDGTAVCGYPPTLSARGAGGRPRLRALDPEVGGQMIVAEACRNLACAGAVTRQASCNSGVEV